MDPASVTSGGMEGSAHSKDVAKMRIAPGMDVAKSHREIIGLMDYRKKSTDAFALLVGQGTFVNLLKNWTAKTTKTTTEMVLSTAPTATVVPIQHAVRA